MIDALDPAVALVVVDLQRGTVSGPVTPPADTIVRNARSLADAFRAAGLPVVRASATGVPPGRTDYGGARPLPEGWNDPLEDFPVADGDIVVERTTWSAFAGGPLHERLRDLGVTQVVVVGLATSFGVESTARGAYDLGYSVAVVTDAVGDRSEASHDHTLTGVLPALAQTGATADVLASLRH
ncbi:cysteine hydrolase family protein [Microbacterium sp. 18062]|uniref:cysteine hydrolase family protein n=1 Tax=Microbacterium sp. 18062 TaxID=2681410 RepID=UPI001357672A|nr:isochorismatase family cysteine hydrolase [Microbacterium sp. 18062]